MADLILPSPLKITEVPTRIFGVTFNATIVPHAVTARFTYIVPASVIALNARVFIKVLRQSAATTLSTCGAFYQVTTDTITDTAIIDITLLSNTIGDARYFDAILFDVLRPGNVIRANTFDSSTGGEIWWAVTLRLTEHAIGR